MKGAGMRRRRNGGGSSWLVVVCGLLLMIVGVSFVGGMLYIVSSQPNTTLAEDQCVEGAELDAHTIIQVDQSDAYSAVQVSALVTVIERARDRLPARGRLTILYLNAESPFEPSQEFSFCSPGRAEDYDSWSSDPQMRQREWEERFSQPLDAVIDKLRKPREAQQSPIVESVRGLEWRPDYDLIVATRELIIVSDMIQNSAIGRFHSRAQPNDADRIVRQIADDRLVPDLTGVSITIELLENERTIPYQTSALRRFWDQLFILSNAKSVNWS